MTKKHLAIEISKEKVIIRVMDGSRVEWESQAKLDPRWLPSDLLTWAEFAINKISVKTKRLGKTLKIREVTLVYDDDWAEEARIAAEVFYKAYQVRPNLQRD